MNERDTRPSEIDIDALIRLPRDERDRITKAMSDDAAELYNDDLAKPVHLRELTAFTALDGDDTEEY